MSYVRPNIVSGATRLTKELVDDITKGIEDAHEELDGRLSETALNGTYAPLGSTGGDTYPPVVLSVVEGQQVLPDATLECSGDSLTASTGVDWPVTRLAIRLGMTVVNRGISGQGAADIITRQGGLRPRVTLSGNQIPASASPVAVTAIDPAKGWRISGTGSFGFAGTIAGVAGSLAHNLVTDAWTFTPTSAPGSAVAVPPGTPFISSLVGRNPTAHLVLWCGRNNVSDLATVRDLIGLAIERGIETQVRRYLIVGVTNGTTEGVGTSNHTAIVKHNSLLKARYGQFFLDIRRGLIDRGLTLAGLTPTAGDVTDIAADRIPGQLMADSLHMNSLGYLAVSELIAEKLLQLGWVNELVAPPSPSAWTMYTSDSYNRADTTAGTLGSTDAAHGGTSRPYVIDSQLQVIGNKLGAVTLSSNRRARINTGDVDGKVSIKLDTLTTQNVAVVGRYADSNNYYFARTSESGVGSGIYRRSGGTSTPLSTSSTQAWSNGDEMELEVEGTALVMRKNGDVVATATDDVLTAGVEWGAQSTFNEPAFRMDDLKVYVPSV